MRATILALMTTLWFTASPGLARNGETGMLIMIRNFEFIEDTQHQTTLVVCGSDLDRISQWLTQGYETSIFLPGYGVFRVEATAAGEVKLHQKDIEIQGRSCVPD